MSFIVGMVLARLLEPADFGLIAMVSTFIGIVSLFIDGGTGSGLVQKKALSQADLSTVFYYNIVIGLLAFIIIFISAPLIASFYDDNRLTSLLRVLALGPLFSSLSVVQLNLMKRQVQLKSRTIAQLLGQIAAAIGGISMALSGFGVWALVTSTLLSRGISTLMYWVQGRWIPSLIFSKESFKEIWSYSGKVLTGNILIQIVNKIDVLVIGRFMSPAVVGFYYKGKSLGLLPATNLGSIITQSYFPILSRLRGDKEEFVSFFSINFGHVVRLALPLFLYLFLNSSFVLEVFYGSKWLKANSFFQLACIIGLLYSIGAYLVYGLNALGRPEFNLRRSYVLMPLRLIAFMGIIYWMPDATAIGVLYVTIAIMLASQVWAIVQLSITLEVQPIVLFAPAMNTITYTGSLFVLVLIFKWLMDPASWVVAIASLILTVPLILDMWNQKPSRGNKCGLKGNDS